MKRVLTSLLAVLVLCLGTGLTLHEHYCMGERVAVSWSHTDGPCPSCGMEKPKPGEDNGCCHDKSHIVKAQAEAVFPTAVSPAPLFVADVPPAPFALPPGPSPNSSAEVPVVLGKPHGPPLSGYCIPLYDRHCNYRI